MKKKINRRSFIKKASLPIIGAASITPFNVNANTVKELSMVTSWPKNLTRDWPRSKSSSSKELKNSLIIKLK